MKSIYIFLFCSFLGYGQVGIGTSVPNESAILEVNSTQKGFLPPRMTRSEALSISDPATGLMVYCTDCNPKGLVIHNGNSWASPSGSLSFPNSGIPISVSAVAGINKVTVSFVPPISTGTSSILDYTVECIENGYTVSGNASPIVVSGLSSLLSYSFRVTARNSSGSSLPSNVSNSVTPIASSINPITYSYVLSTGQSLSTGADTVSPISISQPYDNLSFSPTMFSVTTPFKRLIETGLETPSTAIANTIFASESATQKSRVIVGIHGNEGKRYEYLKKNTIYYNNGLTQFTNAKAKIDADNGILRPLGVTVIHGESDYEAGKTTSPSTVLTYESNLVEWQANYQTDVNSLTGSTSVLPMFINQVNSRATGEIADAQLSAHLNYPGDIILVAPKYQYDYAVGGTHLTNTSSKQMGEMLGKVIKKVAIDGETWNPLMPTTITRTANIVTIRFNVPVGKLNFDTNLVALRTNYGFDFVQTEGTAISITNVTLIDDDYDDKVQITLSDVPTGTDQRIHYAWRCYNQTINATYLTSTSANCGEAGNINAVGGNLRDSDNSISPSTDSSLKPLYNWCVAFNKPIN